MESESSFPSFSLNSKPHALSFWDCTTIFILRPLFAIGFVLSLILLGWLVAWKLVLVHVPLVQEIFGMRKKPVQLKPPIGRLSKIYNAIDAQKIAAGREPERTTK